MAGGINTPYELFRKVGDQLHVLGMGDLEFWYYLSAMTEGPHALLDINGAASFPRFKAKAPDFRDCMLQVTSLGRDVLAAKSDYAHTNIVDKWIGGLHLQGKAPLWRWDLQQRTIVLAGESE
ncbi:RNA polymerase, sigma-24 subunit, ECF subfamily protein [Paenibacillus vortex V453]|uniref:RNA polymerase, sigma-24 subunit, ECF subfamily protein n=1 Tax=Paenibacillus vortex V453 TaxID=715225 RepID=A0A2R9T2L5_9BACL|nr:RNA polymerase, sigma-24 subunit, ECF subfamily protein [Paenibacillus vortex V453]